MPSNDPNALQEEEKKEFQAIDRQRKINRYINIAKKKKSVERRSRKQRMAQEEMKATNTDGFATTGNMDFC